VRALRAVVAGCDDFSASRFFLFAASRVSSNLSGELADRACSRRRKVAAPPLRRPGVGASLNRGNDSYARPPRRAGFAGWEGWRVDFASTACAVGYRLSRASRVRIGLEKNPAVCAESVRDVPGLKYQGCPDLHPFCFRSLRCGLPSFTRFARWHWASQRIHRLR
jgi:hypothetical protein